MGTHAEHFNTQVDTVTQAVLLDCDSHVVQHLVVVAVVGVWGSALQRQAVSRLGGVDAREGVSEPPPDAAELDGLLKKRQAHSTGIKRRCHPQASEPSSHHNNIGLCWHRNVKTHAGDKPLLG